MLPPPPRPRATRLAGWGGGPQVAAEAVRPRTLDELRAAVASGGPRPVALARGLGRAYGDAAQLAGGMLVDTTALRRFELDPSGGVVTAEAGVSLGELLAAVAPHGWTVPVVPGTQHVTVGGAVASDIHGKNHGTAGTFGAHVRELRLLCADGELREISPHRHRELFWATMGGMGLTGVIASARISLAPMAAPTLAVDADRVATLDDALAALLAPGGPYRVAWLDLLGRRPARGVVTRAALIEQAAPGRPGSATVASRVAVPAGWPGWALRPGLVRAYNDYRFRRAPRRETGRLESFGAHMFPLDGLARWPRLYGPAGFVQYQLVVPRGAERALEDVLSAVRRSAVPCYLAVLKDFGAANPAPLSFPLAGWTLALDLPRAAAGLEALLQGFDRVVVEAGGRVYLAKDARMRPQTLAAMYPRLAEWRAVRDAWDPRGRWRSDLGRRLGLVEGAGHDG